MIPGIIGGKGPEATIRLLELIVEKTPARTEEEHLRVLIDNNPAMPKPSLAIEGKGDDPVPAMAASARLLERAGAHFLAIPCNSAHYFLDRIRRAVSIPVMSILDKTVEAIKDKSCGRVGLLATTGLVQSRLYQDKLSRHGIQCGTPDAADQRALMKGILGFKDKGDRGPLETTLEIIFRKMRMSGIQGLVLGCTELPVVLKNSGISLPVFDTLDVLARAIVNECLKGRTHESGAIHCGSHRKHAPA